MKITAKVEGFKELDQALRQFSKSMGKAVLRRTLLKAGQPMADAAERLAPVQDGAGGGRLKKGVGIGTKLSKRQAGLHRKAFKDDRASAEVFVGAGPDPAAHTQEFGTVNHGPQAFMRPAWDQEKNATLDRIKAELASEIDATAKRAAKRAAKKAAKANKG